MSLPIFQSGNKDLSLMQTKWASQLNPVLNNPITNPLLLKGIKLISGDNTINHLLGTKMQGYIISDIDSPVTLYRSQPFNDLTLTLTSSGTATVSIVVF